MLFIGHFSFDEIDADGKQKHGYFSCLTDAETPDNAAAEFEAYIRNIKKQFDEMENVVNVYIEEILKVAQIPQTPIITRFQSSEGAFPPSVSLSLPGVYSNSIEIYGFAADVENQELYNLETFVEAKPFISFERA
jgi:hypothetical protein